MSVIVQTGRNMTMYTKGADVTMIRRIVDGSRDHIRVLEDHIHKYSCRGLRTLVFGMRKVSVQEFNNLQQSYQ